MERLTDLERVCREHRVALAYFFGSQARLGFGALQGGRQELDDPLADVDLGVVTIDPLPAAEGRYQLYSELYGAFADLLPSLPLDLVLLEENHSVFQAQAVAGLCVYAVSEDFRESYEQRILARAADFRPVLDAFYRERLEEV